MSKEHIFKRRIVTSYASSKTSGSTLQASVNVVRVVVGACQAPSLKTARRFATPLGLARCTDARHLFNAMKPSEELSNQICFPIINMAKAEEGSTVWGGQG